MNGRYAKSMQARVPSGLPAPVQFALCGALAVAGCADIHSATTLPPVNPESPVATAVAEASRRTYPTPSFRDVPPAPKGVPAPPDVKVAVVGMIRCRRAFSGYVAAHPQMTNGTAEFAELQRSRVDSNPTDVPTPQEVAASQAYAANLRAYAAPPAPILSGPPLTPADAQPPQAGQPHSHVARAHPPPASHAAPAGPSAPPPATVAGAGEIALDQPLPAARRDPLLAHCP